MIKLDAATVLLQWATGGLLFLWVTTRRRQVGLGYGWLLRGTYLLMAVGAAVVGWAFDPALVRDLSSVAVATTAGVVLVVSIVQRKAGVSGQRQLAQRRAARVAAMIGGAKDAAVPEAASVKGASQASRPELHKRAEEFRPGLDLVAPALGLVGLVAGGIHAGDPVLLSVLRTLAGAIFLGAVSDAMLLGHWYLVQPGLARAPLLELVRWVGIVWPVEVVLLLWPTGMVSVVNGTIDDGYGGMLGWFWIACAVTTIGLVVVTRAALKERAYSAVMAATGLLYLAILTAFGTDLVARAVLGT